MRTCVAALFLAGVFTSSASAQIDGDAPDHGVSQKVGVDCDTFALVAKRFLASRELEGTEWKTCPSGYRCLVFKAVRARNAEGKALSRGDVAKDYLTAKPNFGWKNLGHGYWQAPDLNFNMAASLQLKVETGGCDTKLDMGIGMRSSVFFGILPYDIRGWPLPPANDRLQEEYMAAILKELPR